YLEVSLTAHHKSEAILTDLAAGMNNDPITDQGISYSRTCADRAVASNSDVRANGGGCSSHAAAAGFNAGTNDFAPPNGHVGFGSSTFIDMSLGEITNIGQG